MSKCITYFKFKIVYNFKFKIVYNFKFKIVNTFRHTSYKLYCVNIADIKFAIYLLLFIVNGKQNADAHSTVEEFNRHTSPYIKEFEFDTLQ